MGGKIERKPNMTKSTSIRLDDETAAILEKLKADYGVKGISVITMGIRLMDRRLNPPADLPEDLPADILLLEA